MRLTMHQAYYATKYYECLDFTNNLDTDVRKQLIT